MIKEIAGFPVTADRVEGVIQVFPDCECAERHDENEEDTRDVCSLVDDVRIGKHKIAVQRLVNKRQRMRRKREEEREGEKEEEEEEKE